MTKPFEIPKKLVWEAYQRVKANGGSAGVDQESIERFERRLGDNQYMLWNRMCSGSYFPPPVKSVPIPKKSGGMRVLGVPTVADRVGQTVVKLVLEPMLEPVFHEDSYGYRPGRSALEAVAAVRKRCWKFDWVIEFDINGLFDNIDHGLLMRAVRKHCQNPWVAVCRAVAHGADGNGGRNTSGKDTRHATRGCRQSVARESVHALRFRPLGEPESARGAVLPLRR